MKSKYKKDLILIYINSKKYKSSTELEYMLGYSSKQLDYILKKLEKNKDIVYNESVVKLKITEQGKEYLKEHGLLHINYDTILV